VVTEILLVCWVMLSHEDDAVANCYPVDQLLTPRPGTLLHRVKEKRAFRGVVYLQVKSRFGADPGKQFTATASRPQVADKALVFVFCHFDTDKRDLTDSLWFIPAPAFVAKANPLKRNRWGFVASTTKKSGNNWNEYLIDKRALAGHVLALMELTRRNRE
jgi:hypothetical protein